MNKQDLQESIDIYTLPTFLEKQSDIEKGEYAFAYTISIENNADEAVQLLRRYWLITDGNNDTREVEGEGVVGEQPIILPGDSYRYTSGAILPTSTGTMEGHYLMASASGISFKAFIMPFGLIHPNALQ